MHHVTLSPRRRLSLALVTLVIATVTACGGDDDTTSSTSSTSTTEADGAASDSAGGHSEHGTSGSMGIEAGTVEDVAALGAGPAVGDSWLVPVGLNVCGRFVEAPTGDAVRGVRSAEGATAVVEPTDEASSGHAATVGSYAESAGVELSTGTIVLPEDLVPAEIELEGEDLTIAGTTFRTGDRCGSAAAEVQVWVYSTDAVASGEGILTVVEDPEQVPFAEEGMAVVIALMPESSLPTLPPSALNLG